MSLKSEAVLIMRDRQELNHGNYMEYLGEWKMYGYTATHLPLQRRCIPPKPCMQHPEIK